MGNPHLFVPPTLVERRRITLSPDTLLAWRFVGWTGLALLAAGALDLFVGPPDAASVGGGWAVASAWFAHTAHLLVAGLGLFVASAVARGRRGLTRVGAVAALLLATVSVASGVLQALAAPAAADAVDAATRVVRGARLRAAGLGLVYGSVFALLGITALRHLQRHQHVSVEK